MTENKDVAALFRLWAQEHMDLVNLPIEEQAQYAEGPCEFLAQDEKLATDQLQGNNDYKKWNASSVGCIAYMALNACTPLLREKYLHVLKDYITWFKEQNFTVEKLVELMDMT